MTSITSLAPTRQQEVISVKPTPVVSIVTDPSASAAMKCWKALRRTMATSKHVPRITRQRRRPATVTGAIKSVAGGDEVLDDQRVHRALAEAGFHRLHTYDELETLSHIPGYEYLARDVKLQQMKILSEELQEVTQVDLCDFDDTLDAALGTARLDLSGIMHSVDIDCLNARLRDKGDDSYAILTLHPDDWVAGRAQPADPEARWCNWSLHGRLGWTTRATGDADVREALVSLAPAPLPLPLHHGEGAVSAPVVVARPPGTGVQRGRAVTSRVVDHHVIELADEGSAPLLKYLPNAVTFIEAHLAAAGRRVLVHCKVGHSRSASVVTAYLMHKYYHGVVARDEGARWADAAARAEHLKHRCDAILDWLKEKRPGVRAAEENNFTQQLYAYADYLAYGEMPPIPAAKIKKDGGDQMRDAAVVVFFNHRQRPPLNLIRHYFEKRTPAFYRFSVEMQGFMLKWLVLEKLRWNPKMKLLENIDSSI